MLSLQPIAVLLMASIPLAPALPTGAPLAPQSGGCVLEVIPPTMFVCSNGCSTESEEICSEVRITHLPEYTLKITCDVCEENRCSATYYVDAAGNWSLDCDTISCPENEGCDTVINGQKYSCDCQ